MFGVYIEHRSDDAGMCGGLYHLFCCVVSTIALKDTVYRWTSSHSDVMYIHCGSTLTALLSASASCCCCDGAGDCNSVIKILWNHHKIVCLNFSCRFRVDIVGCKATSTLVSFFCELMGWCWQNGRTALDCARIGHEAGAGDAETALTAVIDLLTKAKKIESRKQKLEKAASAPELVSACADVLWCYVCRAVHDLR